MKIIISPAKKMNVDTDSIAWNELPIFLSKTEMIRQWIREKSYGELKKLWACNDKIAEENFRRFEHMDLKKNLTPALISYEGIAYQYMAPSVFSDEQWAYVQKNLRIISGFYGILKPLDGVVPYRLEMQAKATVEETKNLYDFWGDSIYRELTARMEKDEPIVNLASVEYSKCIEKYAHGRNKFVTVVFGEMVNGKIIQKGTMAKMARGEMVRYMAEHQIEDVESIKAFDQLDYHFNEQYSNETTLVFIKHK